MRFGRVWLSRKTAQPVRSLPAPAPRPAGLHGHSGQRPKRSRFFATPVSGPTPAKCPPLQVIRHNDKASLHRHPQKQQERLRQPFLPSIPCRNHAGGRTHKAHAKTHPAAKFERLFMADLIRLIRFRTYAATDPQAAALWLAHSEDCPDDA